MARDSLLALHPGCPVARRHLMPCAASKTREDLAIPFGTWPGGSWMHAEPLLQATMVRLAWSPELGRSSSVLTKETFSLQDTGRRMIWSSRFLSLPVFAAGDRGQARCAFFFVIVISFHPEKLSYSPRHTQFVCSLKSLVKIVAEVQVSN